MEEIENTSDPDFFIKDERYNISFIDKSDLIIEVLPNRFRFSIRNTSTNLIMWLEDYYLDFFDIISNPVIRLKEIFESHQFLSANYWNSIGISFDFGLNMAIPFEIYDESQFQKYVSAYFGNTEVSEVEFYPYQNTENDIIFVAGFPKNILKIFEEIYKNKNFEKYSIVNGLISQNVSKNSILLHFDNRNLHFFSFDQKSNFKDYKFCELLKNDFEAKLASIFFDFKHEEIVFISGEITNFSPYYDIIIKKIPKLKYAQIKKGIIFSHYFYELPEHRYVGTFSNLKPLLSTK